MMVRWPVLETGQELGESLDDPEDDGVEVVHGRCQGTHGCRPDAALCPTGEPRVVGCRARWIAFCPCSSASSARPGLSRLAPGPGHDDLGPRHRRARGARPAGRLRRGRRHAGRHRGRLHRRRLRAADRLAASATSCARDEIVLATKAGIGRAQGRAGRPTPRAATCSARSTPRCSGSGVDHVDLWQVHTWVDDTPLEETLSALDYAVTTGRAAYVGVSQLHRLAVRAGGDLAARRARAGRALASNQVEYSLLNRAVEAEIVPAARALGLGILPWSPLGRGVLTGKYRNGTPADSRAASPHFATFVGRYLDERSPAGRRGRRPGRRRPRLVPARGGAGLGARPARASPRRSSAPAPPPSCASR